MNLFKPTRFRLRTMAFAVAAVAVAAYSTREWALLRDARNQFESALDGWEHSGMTAENVVLASRRLMNTEAASPWTSEGMAVKRHLERMDRVLEDAEYLVNSQSEKRLWPEWAKRQADFVRREIDKHRTPSNPDP